MVLKRQSFSILLMLFVFITGMLPFGPAASTSFGASFESTAPFDVEEGILETGHTLTSTDTVTLPPVLGDDETATFIIGVTGNFLDTENAYIDVYVDGEKKHTAGPSKKFMTCSTVYNYELFTVSKEDYDRYAADGTITVEFKNASTMKGCLTNSDAQAHYVKLVVGEAVFDAAKIHTLDSVKMTPDEEMPVGFGNVENGFLEVSAFYDAYDLPVDIYIFFDVLETTEEGETTTRYFINTKNQVTKTKTYFQSNISTAVPLETILPRFSLRHKYLTDDATGRAKLNVPEGTYTFYSLILPANTTFLSDLNFSGLYDLTSFTVDITQ